MIIISLTIVLNREQQTHVRLDDVEHLGGLQIDANLLVLLSDLAEALGNQNPFDERRRLVGRFGREIVSSTFKLTC